MSTHAVKKLSRCLAIFGLFSGLALLVISKPALSAPVTSKAWESLKKGKHSIAQLEEGQFYKWLPVKEQPGEVFLWNPSLMKFLGLINLEQDNVLTPSISQNILGAASIAVVQDKNQEASAGQRLATYYDDGGVGFSSGTGDGRALWLADIVSPIDGRSYTVSTKGTESTGLGYLNYPGHSDGLMGLPDAIQEFMVGEMLYRMGISTSSRIVAIIKTDKFKIYDGKKIPAAILVRASPTNLRLAHLWRYKDDPVAMRKLLTYFFSQDRRFAGLSFEQSVKKLVLLRTRTSARELAMYDNLLLNHGSPARGNQLLTGELMDYGSFQIFDQYYRDFYLYRSLGSMKQQKAISLYWDKETRKVLQQVADVSDIPVEQEYEAVYKDVSAKVNLVRLGLTETQADLALTRQRPLVYALSDSLTALRNITSRRKTMTEDKRNMLMPVLDYRGFLSRLRYSDLFEGKRPWPSEIPEFMRKFGTKYSGLPFNTQVLKDALSGLEGNLHHLVEILSKMTQTTPQALAQEWESRAAKVNSFSRGGGLLNRIDRYLTWEKWIEEKSSPTERLATMEGEIDRNTDMRFRLPGNEVIRSGSTPEQIFTFYLAKIREWEIRGTANPNEKVFVPGWFRDFVRRHPALNRWASLPDFIDQSTVLEITHDIDTSAYYSNLCGSIDRALDFARKFPHLAFPVLYDVIAKFPSEMNFDLDHVKSKIDGSEAEFWALKTVLTEDFTARGRPFKLELMRNGDQFGIKASIHGKVILTDGTRILRSGVLLVSNRTTVIDPEYARLGLYTHVFEMYRAHVPGIQKIELPTENIETLEFISDLRKVMNESVLRNRIFGREPVLRLFSQYGIDTDLFLKGDGVQKSKVINLLLTSSLQGHSRLKAGWYLELEPGSYNLMYSRRLSDPERASLTKFEKAMEAQYSSDLKTELRSEILALVPRASLQRLEKVDCVALIGRTGRETK